MKNIRFFYRYTCFNLWISSFSMAGIVLSLISGHHSPGLCFAIFTGLVHLADAFLKLPLYKDLDTYAWRKGFLISVVIVFMTTTLIFFIYPVSHVPGILLGAAGFIWGVWNSCMLLKDKHELRNILDQKELIYF